MNDVLRRVDPMQELSFGFWVKLDKDARTGEQALFEVVCVAQSFGFESKEFELRRFDRVVEDRLESA